MKLTDLNPTWIGHGGEGISDKAGDIIALRKFLRNEIREACGVPPEIMGQIENSNRATIEAAAFMARWVNLTSC